VFTTVMTADEVERALERDELSYTVLSDSDFGLIIGQQGSYAHPAFDTFDTFLRSHEPLLIAIHNICENEDNAEKRLWAVGKAIVESERKHGGEMDYEILEAMLTTLINTTERRLRRAARLATAYERFSELVNADIDPPPREAE